MSRRILLIAVDCALVSTCRRMLPREDYELDVYPCPAEAIKMASASDFDAVLVGESPGELNAIDALRQLREADVQTPILVLGGSHSVESAVAAMKEGAADYLCATYTVEDLQAALSRVTASGLENATQEESNPVSICHGFEGMLGTCAAMREVFALVKCIAQADSTVLVTGESGTGKEMVVRAIHHHSRRHAAPLLACDCTALAPTLLESELFGHVKGSFSGAIATKQGLFEVAHQGTLFLDEVANLSLETQGKLLRVLESRRVRKVGDTTERDVNIRLIATTNRSLAEMVKSGNFRADLYYRLNVVPITLPPLRERMGDIRLLANCFLRQFSRQAGVVAKGFSREAMRQMEVYHWPGNVRELRNIVERLSVLYGGLQIEHHHLPWEVRETPPDISVGETPSTWEELKRLKRQVIDNLEQQFLLAAMKRSANNVTQAADNVGMQRTNFHALLRSHGMKPKAPPED